MNQKIEKFKIRLKEIFKAEYETAVFSDYLRRFAHGVDASCYRYVPELVINISNEQNTKNPESTRETASQNKNQNFQTAQNTESNTESTTKEAAPNNYKSQEEWQIAQVILAAQECGVSLTFRAAGTSLSGQACAKDALVICDFDEVEVLEGAKAVKCGVSAIGSAVNDALAPYGKKIGPDPATIASAKIGGIYSNNSSGMCCGVAQNSYQTIKSIRAILSNGALLDTATQASYEEFAKENPLIITGLLNLRDEIVKNPKLAQKIRKKYSIKNTTGYSLNALLDYEHPRDILNHIFIGAEGTLGFLREVTYNTVPDLPHKACALLFFSDIMAASNAILLFAKHQNIVTAAEIMDYACLESVKHLDGLPGEIQKISEGNCLILIQLEAQTREKLTQNIEFLRTEMRDIQTIFPVNFSFDAKEQASWWLIRKGLLPLSAANRPAGSIVITEDVCFFIDDFTRGIARITELFARFNYRGIIFGHALSGNVHFIITPTLDNAESKAHFARFMEALAQEVCGLGEYSGSIKAEHGTGRMVAPFVEMEWGTDGWELNRKIKSLFDPAGVFNKDVLLSDDAQIHLKNLKPSFAGDFDEKSVETKIYTLLGKCMECGFCEKSCPSRFLTLTPRMRIAVFMEILRLRALDFLDAKERAELAELERGFAYFGVETCATCSACANLCPLKIDTANLALNLKRAKNAGSSAEKIAVWLASHLDSASSILRVGLGAANAFGGVARGISAGLNKLLGTPQVVDFMPLANTSSLRSGAESPTGRHCEPLQRNGEPRSIHNAESPNAVIASDAQHGEPRSINSMTEGDALESWTDSTSGLPRDGYAIARNDDSKVIDKNRVESPNAVIASEREARSVAIHNAESPNAVIASEREARSVAINSAELRRHTKTPLEDSTSGLPRYANCVGSARNDDSTSSTRDATIRNNAQNSVIYFTSCLNRIFAPSPKQADQRPIQEVFASLANKAGINIITPKNIEKLCCGKAFKDYEKASNIAAQATFNALKDASANGAIPIVCDHSACALELLIKAKKFGETQGVALKIYDMATYALNFIAPRVKITKSAEPIALYAPCPTRHHENRPSTEADMVALAKLCADSVLIDTATKCCGFAGNKGFTNPALNAAALSKFVRFYAPADFSRGFSSSSTCEVGLSAHTQKSWQHIIYLLDSCAAASDFCAESASVESTNGGAK